MFYFAVHFQFRISGMSSPYSWMYCVPVLCSPPVSLGLLVEEIRKRQG
jgi:hypothetical protein